MKKPVYLDHHATTPVDPRVLEAMLPLLKDEYGNASSAEHAFGVNAGRYVERARNSVAKIIGAKDQEIIFTSGATESNNFALQGVCKVYEQKGKHLITQATEHKSVLDVYRYLEKNGFEVSILSTDQNGRIKIEELKRAIREQTLLISVMVANNEIGTIQPIQEIGELAKSKGIFFHVDAAQAVGKLSLDVEKMGIDLMSFSAHKMYGPKGVGALYLRETNPRVRIAPLLYGGGQEKGLRPGTLNVPGIVGFGRACEIAALEMESETRRISSLRDRLYRGIKDKLGGVDLNGEPKERLAGNLNLSFAGVDSESLIQTLAEEVAVSTGSACISAKNEPSYVLKALGLREERIQSSIRFGLGRFNTEEEIDYVVGKVTESVSTLRDKSPLNKV